MGPGSYGNSDHSNAATVMPIGAVASPTRSLARLRRPNRTNLKPNSTSKPVTGRSYCLSRWSSRMDTLTWPC